MKKLFVRLLLVLAGLASDSVNVAWQRPCLSHGHFADRRLRGRQSSSATAPRSLKTRLAAGVAVSIGALRLTEAVPKALNCARKRS